MNRQWMYIDRRFDEFTAGLDNFMAVAEANKHGGFMYCPCVDCKNTVNYARSSLIHSHLLRSGFMPSYYCWTKHGERGVMMEDNEEEEEDDDGYPNFPEYDDTAEGNEDNEVEDQEAPDEPADDDLGRAIADARRECETEKERLAFDKMIEDHNKLLYPTCEDGHKKLGSTLELLQWKAENGVTDSGFGKLLTIIKRKLPRGNELPASTYEAKKIVCPLGLDVQKIHACINDCILYRDEYENLDACPVCTALRYKIRRDDPGDVEGERPRKRVPAKVMWYAPIIPRLKRLFRNKEHARLLRWHKEDRKKDVMLRHPADGSQWRKIDREFPNFAQDARNLRFGLSTDGMNPFGEQSCSHSTWPVTLCIYNLPPWLCMKRKFIMMPVLIQGPKQPGNDIDVYLKPLVEELLQLWSLAGVRVWDEHKQEEFDLRAMLFVTINDWPALGNISGQSNKGYNACTHCLHELEGDYLEKGQKVVYLGHRRFLRITHPVRKKGKHYNGEADHRRKPPHRDGVDIFGMVKDLDVIFGKGPGGRIKVPSGFSSNIKGIINMEKKTFQNLKSHDCHVIMTQLLPIALRGLLPENVRLPIVKLCAFLNAISQKVINPEILPRLQNDVVQCLVSFELVFPPSFFNIMTHLLVHLVDEISILGPVFLHNMFPFERFMGVLKKYVHNRARPEGSISKGYGTEEVIEFCVDFIPDLKPIGVPESRHEGRLSGKGTLGRKSMICRDGISLTQAHYTVLQSSTMVAPYIGDHKNFLRSQNPGQSNDWIRREHMSTFGGWLQKHLLNNEDIDDQLYLLAQTPSSTVVTFQGLQVVVESMERDEIQENFMEELIANGTLDDRDDVTATYLNDSGEGAENIEEEDPSGAGEEQDHHNGSRTVVITEPSGSSTSSVKSRKRGPAKKLDDGVRHDITHIEKDGKPIAPEKGAKAFIAQCGVLVRDHVPITVREWHKPKGLVLSAEEEGQGLYIDDVAKNSIMDKLMSHFNIVPEEGGDAEKAKMEQALREFGKKKMAELFKSHKKRLRRLIKIEKTPDNEKVKTHWEEFVKYTTESEEFKRRSEINKANAALKLYHQILGPGGYRANRPKWQAAEAELTSKGIRLGTHGWIERCKEWFYGIGGTLDPETGKCIYKKAHLKVPIDALEKAHRDVEAGLFQPERENDELTRALGNKEHGGRTRGTEGSVPWKYGFPAERKRFPDKSHERRKARETDRLANLEEDFSTIKAQFTIVTQVLTSQMAQGQAVDPALLNAIAPLQSQPHRKSSVASSKQVDDDDDDQVVEPPRYPPVDDLTESRPCELHVKVFNLSFKAAVGIFLPTRSYHCRPVQDDFAVVMVDEVLRDYEGMVLEHPAGEDGEIKELGEARRTTVQWRKENIVFPGEKPPSRPPPPPPPPPAGSPPRDESPPRDDSPMRDDDSPVHEQSPPRENTPAPPPPPRQETPPPPPKQKRKLTGHLLQLRRDHQLR
ncbi:hypothetical protein QYE76_018960 [Lolium multiflorum]|uniref:Transposon protein, putative, CACTA, En/Spm sub-class n=1 Tax=Lolium multiflorum TaxID=4521 RepID=A0AAD8QJE4_LOLMU|nr:hypothetical protein QYE76_018960 [Lolium multiflorum]